MASSPLSPIVSGFNLTTVYQEVYLVPSGTNRIGIDAAVFNNYSASNVTYSVRLVQSGASDQLDEIITDAPIRAGQNNLAPAMIGQAVMQGGKIEAKASANSSVSLTITATKIT